MGSKNKTRGREKTRPCVHCSRLSRRIRRGLCEPCYRSPEIRREYASAHSYREPTAEEVEQCIREQLQCLPDWWQEHERRMIAGDWDQ